MIDDTSCVTKRPLVTEDRFQNLDKLVNNNNNDVVKVRKKDMEVLTVDIQEEHPVTHVSSPGSAIISVTAPVKPCDPDGHAILDVGLWR